MQRRLDLHIQLVLDLRVYGGHHMVAVDRLDVAFIIVRHLVAACVLRNDISARDAGQLFVVVVFQTVEPLPVRTGKTDGLRRHIAGGIIALVGRLEVHLVFESVVLDEGEHAVGGLFVHVFLDGLIASAGHACLFQNKVILHAEDLGKPGRDQLILPVARCCLLGSVTVAHAMNGALDRR